MDFKKDDIYSLLGTLVFHLVIFLILWFTVLKTVLPEEDEGILVNFGNLNAASGTFEPRYTGEITPQPQTPPPPSASTQTQEEELVTQDIEESISLEDAKKEEERKREEERRRLENIERERIRREEAERQRLDEERRRREEEITNRVAGAFGRGTTDGTSQGDSAVRGEGNQGNPFGNSDQGSNEGVGGYGSFNLNGRSLGAGGLPRPAYTIQEEGRIVIDITVDPRGNVISTGIGRGTNIANESMRKSALDAARKAKFNSINGTNNQSGTITYIYKLL
ncbi:MAG: energy transducer TonB [Tannerellaceae bacterium]|jgi:TonB family protein|nr:energy transducer TonB [Tannerellaceae bacterium]